MFYPLETKTTVIKVPTSLCYEVRQILIKGRRTQIIFKSWRYTLMVLWCTSFCTSNVLYQTFWILLKIVIEFSFLNHNFNLFQSVMWSIVLWLIRTTIDTKNKTGSNNVKNKIKLILLYISCIYNASLEVCELEIHLYVYVIEKHL